MRYTKNPNLNPGDMARVTGDTDNRWQHMVEREGLVELLRYDDSDDSWEVEYEQRRTWVAQIDLKPDYEPVTDEEIAELFGLKRED